MPAPDKPVIIQEEEKPFSMTDGEKIFIRDFRLEGAEKGDEATLLALLTPYRNRDLTMTEITEAANRLTIFHRNKGYLVAKAYIPKQDARDGVLTIRIVMGSYGTFALKNKSPVRDSFLQGVFDNTKDDASPVVTKAGLERAILVVRDLPGCAIPTVTLAPGTLPGTTDFEVNVPAGQRVNGYLMADNQGSRFTGRNRVYGGIDLNSPTGSADKLSVSGMITEDADLWNARLAYGFPLARNGLRGEVAAARTNYQLGGEYSYLNAVGVADSLEGTVFYPVRKTSEEAYDLSVNFAYKKLWDDLWFTSATTHNRREGFAGTVAMQRNAYGSLLGQHLFTNATASFSVGSVEFTDADSTTLEQNNKGANSKGIYSKFDLALGANLELTEDISAKASFKMQQVLSAANIDSSEQFFISGLGGVKAYSESVGFDNGYLVNLEVKYALPSLGGYKHSLGAFFDHGLAYAEKGEYAANDIYILSDAGVGYYAGYKQLFCTAQVAQPVGKTSGVNDPGTRFLLQFGAAF
ncbi:ShlB/FhaC/HecB family hemolysin secretion/activation protein [Geobacter sp. FeAm09]|uniref:ShlB/FhaC/HecB family hemolysin secretion/activation protein n=1 Tax=Geobacter sp. FeAm09 TaxID=2597769 RepID=UPI0011EDED45|nr:POTRA domain-containing protein [Geobacter sp. FeAm09]QEM68593.1 ShlB/FhaC/HecB family hemolysin secretion/activation protein [Geobacter sp. FeAm09]